MSAQEVQLEQGPACMGRTGGSQAASFAQFPRSTFCALGPSGAKAGQRRAQHGQRQHVLIA